MTSTSLVADLRAAAQLLRESKRILVLSGAGISKASGIPTYRDADGLWETGDNIKYSHIDGYRSHPEAFAKFWEERRGQMRATKPNPAHQALHELQKNRPGTLLVTQNVDGLLQQAGCTDVLELHGNLWRSRCGGCSVVGKGVLGRCIRCGRRMRPDVVMFGEMLPEDVLLQAQIGATQSDLVLVTGTSAAVYPAADLPITALRYGAKLVIVDVQPPPGLADAAHAIVVGPAEKVLPELMDRAFG